MKSNYLLSLSFCFVSTVLFCQSNQGTAIDSGGSISSPMSSQPKAKVRARKVNSYGKLPLNFEANSEMPTV